jgi:phytoene desaturase (3,4-didehydrolycopene-forming)
LWPSQSGYHGLLSRSEIFSDPSAAPEGKDAIVVLVPIGSLLVEEHRTEEDWIGLVAKAKKQVIEVMEGRLGIKGMADMIVWEEVNTPVSCE